MIDEFKEVWKLDPFTIYHLKELWPILIIIIGLIPVIYFAMVHGHIESIGNVPTIDWVVPVHGGTGL